MKQEKSNEVVKQKKIITKNTLKSPRSKKIPKKQIKNCIITNKQKKQQKQTQQRHNDQMDCQKTFAGFISVDFNIECGNGWCCFRRCNSR